MARETKVGLLAGLAFIVCFAVILANRGRQDLIAKQLPAYPAERIASRDGTTTIPRLGTSRQAPAMGGHEVLNGGSTAPTVLPRIDPPRMDRGASVNPPGVAPTGFDGVHPLQEGPGHAEEAMERVKLLEKRLNELAGGGPTSSGSSATQPTKETGVVLRASSATGAPAVSQPPSPASASHAARYTIVAGDTLSRIAATYYGSKSTTIINAIFDANRGVLPGPHELPLGVELVLPLIAGTKPQEDPAELIPKEAGMVESAKPVSSTAKPVPKAKSPPEEKSFRWYQVQKNDRYVSIARQQLGDGERWREIFELNKDKFPDAGQIREGVRIKLPAAEMADSRERRR